KNSRDTNEGKITETIIHIKAKSHYNSENYSTAYTITNAHTDLLLLANSLNTQLDIYEKTAQKYIIAAANDSKDLANTLIQQLIEDITALHTFFNPSNFSFRNSIEYVEKRLLNYFKKLYPYNIAAFVSENLSVESIIGKTYELFEKIFLPLILFKIKSQKVECPLSNYHYDCKKHCKNMWNFYLISSKEYSSDLPQKCIIDTIKDIKMNPHEYDKAPTGHIFSSLYRLRSTLWGSYIHSFSELFMYMKNISSAQAYCLFLRQNPHIARILEDLTLYNHPHTLYEFLTENMTATVSSEFFEVDKLFDRCTIDANDTFPDYLSDPEKNMSAFKKIQEALDTWIPSEKDSIFHQELGVVYSFEQLIYIEILELVKNRVIIRKCASPNCNNYFTSNSRKQKYCNDCSSSKNIYNKKYRESQRPVDHTYTVYINFFRQQKVETELLNKWKEKAKELLEKYKQNNMHDDVVSFTNELNIICDTFNLKYTGRSKYVATSKV
ncbi:MAG: hypothetical protein NC124_18660, partial [Clostridium sp.]|nr:hypothetical protein [Clostridium sp.]